MILLHVRLHRLRLKKSLSALKYQLNWKHLEHCNSKVSTITLLWLRFPQTAKKKKDFQGPKGGFCSIFYHSFFLLSLWCLGIKVWTPVLCSSIKYPYLPHGRDFFIRAPHPSGNSNSTSYISLIFLVFGSPPPPRNFQSLLWGSKDIFWNYTLKWITQYSQSFLYAK